MFEIRWIQNDSTIIKRQLPDALGSREFVVSTAVKDLLYSIAYNEDAQLSNLDFFEPLHLEIRFEIWAESIIYSSLNQNSILNPGSFVIGGDVHSFYGFYTAHQVLWESKRFYERQMFRGEGPLYELFYWRFMTDKGLEVNLMFDREYSFRSDLASVIEVKASPTEYINIQEELRRSLTTKRFYSEHPKFFKVLAHPIKGMRAYSKKHNCCTVCNKSVTLELEYGYCMSCAKEYLLPFSEKTRGLIDCAGLRQSKLVDKNDFYSGNDFEYWVTPDGELGSRDTSLPF
jgi:hypothetical protein